ncbi:glycerate kinase type-2 family protein [Oleidesulfovibrio sp.]|uniref:glycerate kinase type-2 family protein n=1 Tax=Oleidesulfovibrio sp. TaxID=2909707 RepID=UPI003A86ADD7
MTRNPKNILRTLLDAALLAVAPDKAVYRHVTLSGSILRIDGAEYNLEHYDRILVVGAGKGAAPMAAALENLLGDRISQGAICVKYDHTTPLKHVTLYEAAHPVPDAAGEHAARQILALAQSATERDLVLCVLTGGASALTPALADNIPLTDWQQATGHLLACGAGIHEINAIRKHVSIFGGGKLARAAYPAPLVALIISDVVGDDLDVIASGPTSPDTSTYARCLEILDTYGIRSSIPASITTRLEAGARGEIEETPKPGDSIFDNVKNVLVANNTQALEAAAAEAVKHGYSPRILTSTMTGEAREKAMELVQEARTLCAKGETISGPVCLLAGGETTVTITGDGLGGRNQEMALAGAMHLQNCSHITMLCAGTDGSDGPTDAAGGFACAATLSTASSCGLDAEECLRQNNSYVFLEKTGNLLKTGPTLTNVMDMALLLVDCPEDVD